MTHPTPLLAGAFSVPIYSQRDAAAIVETTTSSLHRWAQGYESLRQNGTTHREPLVTLARSGRGATVPFVGLAEAYVLASFRRTGVPMQKIRPAIEALKRELPIEHVLASNLLMTDGVEILLSLQADKDEADRLVVVRNHQAVFPEVVTQYLRAITFDDGYASSLRLPRYSARGVEVAVSPRVNGGAPTIVGRGIRVEDVTSRLRAGEPLADVADDFDLPEPHVRTLHDLAA